MDNDDLQFDPQEKVVSANVETGRPLGTRQAAPSGAPASQPKAEAPAIQARPAPTPRTRPPAVAHQLGRRQAEPVEQPAPAAEPQAVPVEPVAVAAAEPTKAARYARPEPVNVKPVVQNHDFSHLPLAIVDKDEKPITAAFEDTWLPSNFAPYTWQSIKIRRLTIEELRAIVRARVSGNLRYLVRAVNATISRDAEELTVGDFWYLMYWHRLNSYKKSPFIIEWTCENQQHIHSVVNGDQVHVSQFEVDGMTDEDRAELTRIETESEVEGGEPNVNYYRTVRKEVQSLKNMLTVNSSNLTTDELDLEKFNDLRARIEAEFPVTIAPQRVMDLIESLEDQINKQQVRKAREAKEIKSADEGDVATFIEAAEEEDMVEDEEQAFAHRYAALLETRWGLTLDARSDYLNQLDPDLLVELEEFLVVCEHGVSESWTVKCNGCGASRTVNQSLDALSFLPSVQRGGFA